MLQTINKYAISKGVPVSTVYEYVKTGLIRHVLIGDIKFIEETEPLPEIRNGRPYRAYSIIGNTDENVINDLLD